MNVFESQILTSFVFLFGCLVSVLQELDLDLSDKFLFGFIGIIILFYVIFIFIEELLIQLVSFLNLSYRMHTLKVDLEYLGLVP